MTISVDMTNTVSQLRPLHEITDPAKVRALVAAYEADQPVSPVVILADERGLMPVCGSHRIAAIKEVYCEDAEISDLAESGYLIVLDFAEVYEDASDELTALLDQIHAPSGDYYTDLCRLLSAECGGEVAAALKDQIN